MATMSTMSIKKAGKQPMHAGPSTAAQHPVASSSATVETGHFHGLDEGAERHYLANNETEHVPVQSQEGLQHWDIKTPITRAKAMELQTMPQALLQEPTTHATIMSTTVHQKIHVDASGQGGRPKEEETTPTAHDAPEPTAGAHGQIATAAIDQANSPANMPPVGDAVAQRRKRDRVAAWMRAYGIRVAGIGSVVSSVVMKILEATDTVEI